MQGFEPHQQFCTKGTYLRYLRARSWNVHKAARMLKDTLAWREGYRPDLLTWEKMETEGRRGKVFVLDNFDREGRPVVFMRPRKEVYGGDNEERLRWVVYIMEMASHLADKYSPDGKMTWLIDFIGYDRRTSPSFKVSLQTLNIVQSHYPERLGKAVNWMPPFLFEVFWKAIKPFVDPVTKEKLVFLRGKVAEAAEDLAKQFELHHLDESLGGTLPDDGMWDVEAYGKRMKKLEDEKKNKKQSFVSEDEVFMDAVEKLSDL